MHNIQIKLCEFGSDGYNKLSDYYGTDYHPLCKIPMVFTAVQK